MGKGKPIFVDLGSVNVGAGNTAGGWSAQDGELGLAAAQPHGYEELKIVIQKPNAKAVLGVTCADIDGLFYSVVSDVEPIGLAYGKLMEGDQIVTVNGMTPRNAKAAGDEMKKAKDALTIEVRRPNDLQAAIAGSIEAAVMSGGGGGSSMSEEDELALALRLSAVEANGQTAGGGIHDNESYVK